MPRMSFLHTWLCKLRPDVQPVIHMHPQSAVLLTTCGFDVHGVTEESPRRDIAACSPLLVAGLRDSLSLVMGATWNGFTIIPICET